MSDEHFLARWSRRKRDAAADSARPDHAGEKAEATARPTTHSDARDPARDALPDAVPQPADPEIDLTKLPSLDSITANTDIRGFLAPGVPASLAREALRRAWVSDPAIRDFRGLQEYDWDFTDTSAVPGFGELGPDCDVKQMVARVFGEGREEPQEKAAGISEEPRQTVHQTDKSGIAAVPAVEPAGAPSHDADDHEPQSGTHEVRQTPVSAQNPEELPYRNKEVAMQNDDVPDDRTQKIRRSQGGALPKT